MMTVEQEKLTVPYCSKWPTAEEVAKKASFLRAAKVIVYDLLPDGYKDYISVRLTDYGAEVYAENNWKANTSRRTFRKIDFHNEFTLTPAHIEKIIAHVEGIKQRLFHRNKQENELASIEAMCEEAERLYTTEDRYFRYSLNGVTISEQYGCSIHIPRDGGIREATIPTTSSNTISGIREHIEKWEARANEFTAMAHRIKEKIPTEFFNPTT